MLQILLSAHHAVSFTIVLFESVLENAQGNWSNQVSFDHHIPVAMATSHY
jgi:hypothetical protein